MSSEVRLPLSSVAPNAERLAALKTLFPEAFTEGKIDFERLKQALGASIQTVRERYSLNWAGRTHAINALQSLSVGTLQQAREESVGFDTTEHLIIEGDNLEVLKLLQKSYFGKVKMIYIDPPYNTGNEFIYPDNFREGLEDYLKFSGQMSAEGTATTSNKETNGRYHSKWLSMMYPRLFLAKNLLRDDGVIFVSIDDHEVYNLRLMMNEIFGEENFLATIVWQKKYAPSNDTVDFSATHDYVMVYGKVRPYNGSGKAIALLGRVDRTEEQNKLYKNPDNDQRGDWASDNYLCNKSAEQRPNLYYPIIHPKTGNEIWPDRTAVWRYSQERHAQNVRENRVWWGLEQENQVPRYKRFLSEVQGVVSDTWWIHKDSGHNDEAKKQLKALFPDTSITFDTPKPSRLIKRIVKLASPDDAAGDDIILDFFAGSGTTAQAVLELNNEDGKRSVSDDSAHHARACAARHCENE
jgi:adenine-specific DNA-methyltransferase